MKVLGLVLVLASSGAAAEYAVLASGARLRADSHEMAGSKVRLFMGGGTTELDAAEVTAFEPDERILASPASEKKAVPKAPPAADTSRMIEETARRYGLPPGFLRSVVKAESGYRADAVSPKGAVGLMQLMPSTAKTYSANAANPAENLEAGARYLSELLLKYGGGVWHALAAYNAGPGAVDKYNGIPPYRETREYIERIMRNWKVGKQGSNHSLTVVAR